jgi:hypothetical protein
MKYNYLENIKNDIIEYVKERKEDLKIDLKEGQFNFDALYDDMFIDDAITGNASGSYTFNTWQAEENLTHNMDLLKEALEEFGYTNGIDQELITNAEWCDVTIRCYLLGQALEELKNDIIDILEEEGADNE